MNKHARSTVRCGLLALTLSACGDEPDVSARPAPTDERPPSFDAGFLDQYEANGLIIGSRPDAGPIAGARVCIPSEDDLPCTVSDWAGTYRIRLPVRTIRKELAVHVTAANHLGFVGTLRTAPMYIVEDGSTRASWLSLIPLMDLGQLDELTREGNLAPPSPNHGLVSIRVSRRGGAPVNERATLTPGNGARALYMSATGKYDSSITAFTESGQVMFVDVEPGRFDVFVSHCHPDPNLVTTWSGSESDAVAGLAVAGAITHVQVICLGEPTDTRSAVQ